MTLGQPVLKNIIKKLINGEDYRIEILTLINAEFLQFAIDFFRRVAEAKLNNKNITSDWYKRELLNLELPTDEIAINSGLNKKTIPNMYNSATREIVAKESYQHYDTLYNAIDELTKIEDLNLSLQIKFNKVSVELDINESLIVINALAVKRAALREGLWSSAGKQTERPLMLTLCELHCVPKQNYALKPKAKKVQKGDLNREVDFFLSANGNQYKCEVKLMGKGNPEGADVVIARDSSVFIADKLSEQNKTQLERSKVAWVELRSDTALKQFKSVLETLQIPHKDLDGSALDSKVDIILSKIFT